MVRNIKYECLFSLVETIGDQQKFFSVLKEYQKQKKIISSRTAAAFNLAIYAKRHRINKSKKEGKDQESIQLRTSPDPGYQWASDNFTIIHHKREPRGQPFPSR